MNSKGYHPELLLYYPLLDPIMPNPDDVLSLYHQYKCHKIEISLPCFNAVLDGKTVKESMKRILEKYTLDDVFCEIKRIRTKFPQIEVELMAYIDIIEEMGYELFKQKCVDHQVNYVLSPDASDEQIQQLKLTFKDVDSIQVVRFVAFEDCEVMAQKAKDSEGYIFMQSGNQKTGQYQNIGHELKSRIDYIRNQGVTTPIMIGFGIQEKKQIQACLNCGAQGVAIGSHMIHCIVNHQVEAYLQTLI